MTTFKPGVCGWLLVPILAIGAAFFAVAPEVARAECGYSICGDGILNSGEECDDGNNRDGDGCDSACRLSFDMVSEPPLFSYPEGYPRSMSAADLNNDGIDDFVVTTFRSAYLYTYLVRSDGSVDQAGRYMLGSNTIMVSSGHLNGDHFIDIVTADADTSEMHIFFGNGDGTMTPVNVFNPGSRPRSVDVGDINSDGFSDIIVGCYSSSGFRIYYGDGQGDFPSDEFIFTGGSAMNSLVADLNGDRFNDLVLGSIGSGYNTRVYHGSRNGLVLVQTIGYPTTNVRSVDMNMDGYPDLFTYGATSSDPYTSKHIRVFLNRGDGRFSFHWEQDTGIEGFVMDTGDLDKDGFNDVTISTRSHDFARVLLGDGSGGIKDSLTYPTPDDNDGVIMLDINNDGTLDILASMYYSSSHREIVPIHNHSYYQFPKCGDGRIGRGENCDDGNTDSGDGCSAACRIEVSADSDHDGLSDNEETLIHSTDPLNPDTDGDCVLDGEEVCSGRDPLDPSDQEGCEVIVTPAGQWRLKVTLTEASAGLKSDVYLFSPVEERLIVNSIKNVGRVATTELMSGEEVVFYIKVFGGPMGLGAYDHYSDSIYARIERIDAFTYEVGFEDLPMDRADWDFNDVVLLVEFLPDEAARGIRFNQLGEFEASSVYSAGAPLEASLAFDGNARVYIPEAALSSPADVTLTAGLAEKYLDLNFGNFLPLGDFKKVVLTNGQTETADDMVAAIKIGYLDQDNDGIVDGTNIAETDLTMAVYDAEREKWVGLAREVDTANNEVTGYTKSFSLFSLGTFNNEPLPQQINCSMTNAGGAVALAHFVMLLIPAIVMRLLGGKRLNGLLGRRQ